MQYELQLNLRYRAALSAALSLWEKKEVKDRVREFFGNYSKLGKGEARYEWHRLTRSLLQESKQNVLPSKLEGELVHIIKEIGERIYHWYLYVEHENSSQYGTGGSAIDYVNEIYWTPYGIIDEVKIFKLFWLDNPSLNVAKVYHMACSYLLKEHVNDLWQKIPKDIQDNSYDDIYKYNDRHILAYWECHRDGGVDRLIEYFQIAARNFGRERMYRLLYNRDHSIEENMLRLSVHEGYSIAAQYFWDKLSEEERDRNLLKCARSSIMRYNDYASMYEDISPYKKEKYVEILVFLLNQMTIGHKEIFFQEEVKCNAGLNFLSQKREVKGEILKMLLFVWPWQELLIPVLDDMLPYLEHDSDTVSIFLEEITKKMIEYEKLGYDVTSCKYRNILGEVWHNLPRSIKEKIVQENKSLDFICNLIDVCDFISIQLIFNDPEIADIRDKYVESGLSRYAQLIKNGQYDLLDQFIEEIFASDVEKKDFKQKINIWEDFIKEEQYDLADRLLDWQSSTDDDRKDIKGQIDHIGLCKYFIMKARYDLADRFLDWRFDTEIERKECKDHFKNDIFSVRLIYTIWRDCRSDIEQSMNRSAKFLYWFLETAEEITHFKREAIANLKSYELLCNYLFMSGLKDIIEDFLSWCMLSKEEMKPLKQELVYENGYMILPNSISMWNVWRAEELLKWAFSEESQKMQSFIEDFILSDDGVESCSEFIKEASDAKPHMPQVTIEEKFNSFIDFWIKPLKNIDAFKIKLSQSIADCDDSIPRENHKLFIDLLGSLAKDDDLSMMEQSRNVDEKTDFSDVLPKEYKTSQESSVILGNKDAVPIPGLPEAFSFYYQAQVAFLLKLRLEDSESGVLKSVNVLDENYTLREGNEDYIAAELSSFILASDKDTILIPLNIGGSHLVGIAAQKDGNKVVMHYIDSELGLPPDSFMMKVGKMLESHSYSIELRITGVERQKYSNCGPEVIENLASFATGTPRASQEEAIFKHSMVLERHLLKDLNYEPTKIAIQSSIPSEKLLAQLQHYIRTGEAFDTARAAIEDGTARIIRQSAVISNDNEEVANSRPLSLIQTYNEDSYHDSIEYLYTTAEFSPDYATAILGLLFSFIVSTENQSIS